MLNAFKLLLINCAQNLVSSRSRERIQVLTLIAEQAQKQSAAYASQTQAMFDRFAEDERLKGGKSNDASVDLISTPMRDDEKLLLETRCKELEEERKKFTEAAVKLGREKASLEVGFSSPLRWI